ncbi:hypothetical protein GCM10028809_69140 [Spirosoma gilvum]
MADLTESIKRAWLIVRKPVLNQSEAVQTDKKVIVSKAKLWKVNSEPKSGPIRQTKLLNVER